MIEGDQPRAALSHIAKALEKATGTGRESLLDLKSTIELSLGDFAEAQATVERFVEVAPKSPTAHGQAAVLAASRQRAQGDEAEHGQQGSKAVDHLQNAMELLEEDMPARVLQAIGAVGQALLVEGNLIAARAHLWLYQGIAGRDDTRAMELLSRLNQVSGLPLMLRDHLYLQEAPVGHPAEERHDHAQMLASRGQWRRAEAVLQELRNEHPDLPMLAYNHGLVCGWLGDVDRLVEGVRSFSRLLADPLSDDAIEAEAIAQLLDRTRREGTIEVVKSTFAVENEEALIDRLLRDPRAVKRELSESELHGIEGPPPRQTVLLLDRELPESGVSLTAADTPRIIGFLSYYGRQTDRPERLEFVADRDEHHEQALSTLAEVAGDAVGEKLQEEVVGESGSSESVMHQRWQFPTDTPQDLRRQLLAEERRRVLLEEWPTKPKAMLDGKTPKEAASDDSHKTALAAAVLVLEQSADGRIDRSVFAELRSSLGLPEPAAIDLATVETELLPLVRLSRVELGSVSDEALLALYERAMLSGAHEAVLALARVGIERPSVVAQLPEDEFYYRLISYESDPVESRRWVEKARESSEAAGRSSATWDILELELCVVSGDLEEANRLIQHIRSEHLEEPGVAEQLYQLLYALGAVPAPGEAMNAPPEVTSAATAEQDSASKLWTPDDGAPASAGGGESKIWTPS